MKFSAEEQFNRILSEPSLLPIAFSYGRKKYKGIPDGEFPCVSKLTEVSDGKETATLVFVRGGLELTLVMSHYKGYNALEYCVYFKNGDGCKNTEVIKDLYALDAEYVSEKTLLKGILGDHENKYKPYERDLVKGVKFLSDKGRATHIYFPYFNLEEKDGGVMFAIGWCGTWEACFGNKNGKTAVKAVGCVGLKTYLKPGEVIRTPLMAFVGYDGDEDDGTNAWRKWIVDCVMPRKDCRSNEPLKPFSTVFLAYDTGLPNSDGSISENRNSYMPSLNAFYDEGLKADFRWFDAGWYKDGNGKTVIKDWHGTVGTWELDEEKWPNGSFSDSVRFAREHGTKTLVWFEPERVTMISALVKNHGFRKEWAISPRRFIFPRKSDAEKGLLNLGNEDAFGWIRNRILGFLEKYDVDLYREDFNTDCGDIWKFADKKEGLNRKGITENKYVQGHYRLWDDIISYCKERGKCTFVDSCASGGGRNDLESLKRAVPLLRSDADRTTIPLRLAMTTSFCKWIPFNGAGSAHESQCEVTSGTADEYVFRASMLPVINFCGKWSIERDLIDYESYRKCQKEWAEIAPYFLKDFYTLTPYCDVKNDRNWTVYEYFDRENDSGVIQAFRQPKCKSGSVEVRVRGLNPQANYKIKNIDGGEAIFKGETLTEGFVITAEKPRTALIYMVEKA